MKERKEKGERERKSKRWIEHSSVSERIGRKDKEMVINNENKRWGYLPHELCSDHVLCKHIRRLAVTHHFQNRVDC